MTKNNPILFLCVFLFFSNSIITLVISYLPIYFEDKGFTGSEIGFLLAIGPFIGLFSQPLWGYYSDKYKTVKKTLILCLIGLLISSIFLFNMDAFTSLVIIFAFFFLFMSALGGLGDNLAKKTSMNNHIPFGKIRMWGSLGFACTSLITGKILSIIGIQYLYFPFFIIVAMTIMIGFLLNDASVSDKPIAFKDAAKLAVNKKLIFFLATVMFITTTHRTNDNFIGMYVTDLGGDEGLIGWLWFIGVFSEALVFAFSAYWFRRFQPLTFVIFAGFIYSFRWLFMSIADQPVEIMFLQLTHGICFAVLYVSCLEFLSEIVPDELQSTGHLLFLSISFGLSGIIGALFGGFTLDNYGGSILYEIMGYMALTGTIGLLVFRLFYRLNQHKHAYNS
ncbi:MFS transporter [Thalassobacillus pellis]|uniref:MFS transporter n=1 Tax=Thalassobacillus pellis TaxID=748008 RepID=UPI001961B006|nr:MFS transporter [Thalassobacillus pellis]MBM7553387.1 oligosaccharide:H+ symporter [Thalassobacillus pellis]